MTELIARGHDVCAYEPADAWSVTNLIGDCGDEALNGYREAYPNIRVTVYEPDASDWLRAVETSDLILVHEWNRPDVIARLGSMRARRPDVRILFVDTHHRSVTAPEEMRSYDLSEYDGALVFGNSIRRQYEEQAWARNVWTWHEAADTRVFFPKRGQELVGDLVWIGNWGDEERTEEIREFLIGPVRDLGLRARVYGVRYPKYAIEELSSAGIEYCGWLPNYRVPEIFGRFRMTVHIPRRPYSEALPGIPTIRVFEALACGIPLISAPWSDSEQLFGESAFIKVRDGQAMRSAMDALRSDPALGDEYARRGLEVIERRHTCAHRVTELLSLYHRLEMVQSEVAV